LKRASSNLKKLLKRCFHRFVGICLKVAVRDLEKELAVRHGARGSGSFRWFTPEEALVAEALARTIVPSDEEAPGADEVGVLDAPAIVTLDRLVAASAYRQYVYSRGLLGFDAWAHKERNCSFGEMPKEDQITFFRIAQQNSETSAREASGIQRAWRRLREIGQVRDGRLFAALLYPQMRYDCLQVFYTSRVSWTWLEYDGPPMENGYPSVTAPRDPSANRVEIGR
jgi:hypothetical protein